MLAIARQVLGSSTEAEDLVQEVMLSVWRRFQSRPIENLTAYAKRATRMNALRLRERQRTHVPLDGQAHAIVTPPSDAVELERAIAALPLAQQTVVRLRFYVGLSFRQIGQRLSITTNTAASRTRYALERLRQTIKEKP